MCLTKASILPRITIIGRKCYKFVWRDLKSGRLTAYYQPSYHHTLKEIKVASYFRGPDSDGDVNYGFHSFVSYDDLKNFLYSQEGIAPGYTDRLRGREVVIVECTIPPGTVYYVGRYAGFRNIASKRIIINKIL